MSRDRSQVDLSENKRATEKGRMPNGDRARGGEGARGKRVDEGEVGEISASSITNSCPSIDCRYIQTLLRKGQSLCRPLCRPRAFLLLSLSSLPPPPPPSSLLHLYFILSRALAFSFYTSFPPQSRFSSVERGGPHSSILLLPLRRWEMRPRTRRWEEEDAESGWREEGAEDEPGG